MSDTNAPAGDELARLDQLIFDAWVKVGEPRHWPGSMPLADALAPSLAALTTPVIPNGASVEDAGQGSTSVESALREPVAWLYERTNAADGNKPYSERRWVDVVTLVQPLESPWLRNIRPLYTASPVEDAADAGSTLNEQTVELREALEPFAKVGDFIEQEWWPDTNNPLGILDGHKLLASVNSSAFRNARAVLAQHHPKDDRDEVASRALRWLADQETLAEAMDSDPPEWAELSPPERIQYLAKRKEARDAAILAARTALENKLMKGGEND